MLFAKRMGDERIRVIDDLVIPPEELEFILNHGALSRQATRGDRARDNVPCFSDDLRDGLLEPYNGTFVAYHKGTLCGQSSDGPALYTRAKDYYGSSDLAVFRVPSAGRQLPLEGALGQY